MKHNSILKRLLIMIAMVCVMLTAMAFVVTASAEVQTGIDLVILLDSSYSMSGYKGSTARDPLYKRLDAAVMMINMCDSTQSRVAVVPFSDHIFGEGSGESDTYQWHQIIDISDASTRSAFCDRVISRETFSASSENTYFAGALAKAEELLLARQQEGSTNKPVVLLLTDGVNTSTDQEASLEIAERIKALGADIYCVSFGADSQKVHGNLLALAGNSEERNERFLQEGENSDQVVDFFSNIFATLIDSRKRSYPISIEDGNVDIQINVPNGSVYEINLLVPMNIAAKNASIQVARDGESVSGSDSVYIYEHTDAVKATKSPYDYISIKLINPDAGEWHITFPASDEASPTEAYTYDILYNYDVNLEASSIDASFLLNQDIVLGARFIKTDGSTYSSDTYMYDIPATYEIKAQDGSTVLSGAMQKANDGLSYTITIPAAELCRALGSNVYQTYVVHFHAEDETMFRDSINDVSFSIVNAAPERTEESIDLGVIRIDDVLNPNTQDGQSQCDVSDYFDSVDGDALTYQIDSQSDGDNEVTASIDGATLTISKAGEGTVTDGWVDVVAVDPQGSKSAPVRFNVKVLSVRQLVEDCVSIKLKAETESSETSGEYKEVNPADDDSYKIPKGQSIRLTADYVIEVPEGASTNALPYSELGSIVTDAALHEVAGVEFTNGESNENNGPTLTYDEGSYTAVLASGEIADASMTVAFSAVVGGVEKSSEPLTFIVTNADPTLNEDVQKALTDLGGVEEPVDANAPDGDKIVFFDVDRDNPDDNVLAFAVDQWFTDSDTIFGSEALSYSVEILPLEETKDIFSFARKILRTIGMADKEGAIVTLDGADFDEETGVVTANLGESGQLKLDAKRFGNAFVTVTATDKSEASVTYQIGYHVTSSQEQLKCLIVYTIMLLILIIIIIILINRLIIHAKWFTGNNSRYEVILNGYNQFSNRGEQASKFNKTGRKAITLRELAKQFDIQDGGSGNALFSAIRLWPTTGGRIVVEGPKRKPRDGEVLVDGRKLGTKAKWSVRGNLTCKYKDGDGVEHTCVFKRV